MSHKTAVAICLSIVFYSCGGDTSNGVNEASSSAVSSDSNSSVTLSSSSSAQSISSQNSNLSSENQASSASLLLTLQNDQTCIHAAGTLACTEQTYKTVSIGSQIWMAENLNVGKSISGVSPSTDSAVIEKYCYNNQDSNCTTYGGLYQWSEALGLSTSCIGTKGCSTLINPVNHQGICPHGWHIPSSADWDTLANYVDFDGDDDSTNNNEGAYLKGVAPGTNIYWNNPSYSKLTDAYGFNAQPAGLRESSGSFMYSLGALAQFWVAADIDMWKSQFRFLNTTSSSLYIADAFKDEAMSVRCMMNH